MADLTNTTDQIMDNIYKIVLKFWLHPSLQEDAGGYQLVPKCWMNVARCALPTKSVPTKVPRLVNQRPNHTTVMLASHSLLRLIHL